MAYDRCGVDKFGKDVRLAENPFQRQLDKLGGSGSEEKNQPPLVLSLKPCPDFIERSGKAHCKSCPSHGLIPGVSG